MTQPFPWSVVGVDDIDGARRRGGAAARPGCTGSRTAGAPCWRRPREAPRAADRGGLHLPAAQRRRSPPGSACGSASASASASSPAWSATTRRTPASRSRSRPARRGATGSPRACTSSPGTAAVPLLLVKLWTRLPAAVHPAPEGAPGARGRGARAGVDRGAGRGRDLPAGLRPVELGAVVPVELLVPDHPLRDRLGRDRRAGRAHRGEAADHPRRPDERRRRHDVRPGVGDPARARCRGAGCSARPGWPPAWRCWPTAGSTVPFLRDVSVFGVRSGDGPRRHPDQQVRRGGRGDRDGREPGVPSSPSSTATARCAADPRRPARR